MPRIPGIDPTTAEGDVKTALDAQTKRWGAPLGPYLLYARRPAVFKGANAMWGALHGAQRIDAGLRALLNRRVASINGCEF